MEEHHESDPLVQHPISRELYCSKYPLNAYNAGNINAGRLFSRNIYLAFLRAETNQQLKVIVTIKRHSHEEQTRLRKGQEEKIETLVLIDNSKLHEQVSTRMHFY